MKKMEGKIIVEEKEAEKTKPNLITLDTDIENIKNELLQFWIPDTLKPIDENNSYYIKKVDNHIELGICEINFNR